MNTTLTIKTPKKLRNDVKKTADRLGLPVTTIVNALLLQFVRDENITLSLKPRPEKMAEWKNISEEMDAGAYAPFENVEVLIDHLGLEKNR